MMMIFLSFSETAHSSRSKRVDNKYSQERRQTTENDKCSQSDETDPRLCYENAEGMEEQRNGHSLQPQEVVVVSGNLASRVSSQKGHLKVCRMNVVPGTVLASWTTTRRKTKTAIDTRIVWNIRKCRFPQFTYTYAYIFMCTVPRIWFLKQKRPLERLSRSIPRTTSDTGILEYRTGTRIHCIERRPWHKYKLLEDTNSNMTYSE